MGLGQLTELSDGMNLLELRKLITQENINLYAEASRDFNPIHIDGDFARQTPLGQNWLTGGKLNVRFKNPARPGDTITVSGRISKIESNEGQTLIRCDVLCENQSGDSVITGEASVRAEKRA